jgi:ribonuclease G
MSKEMFISSSSRETKLAVVEEDQLVEVFYERDTDVGLVGGIYKGRVSRVLPGMQSAFVDIGLERDAFLYVSDFFFEDQEDYDKILEEAEASAVGLTPEQAQAAVGATPPAEATYKEATPQRVAPVPAIAPSATRKPFCRDDRLRNDRHPRPRGNRCRFQSTWTHGRGARAESIRPARSPLAASGAKVWRAPPGRAQVRPPAARDLCPSRVRDFAWRIPGEV